MKPHCKEKNHTRGETPAEVRGHHFRGGCGKRKKILISPCPSTTNIHRNMRVAPHKKRISIVGQYQGGRGILGGTYTLSRRTINQKGRHYQPRKRGGNQYAVWGVRGRRQLISSSPPTVYKKKYAQPCRQRKEDIGKGAFRKGRGCHNPPQRSGKFNRCLRKGKGVSPLLKGGRGMI